MTMIDRKSAEKLLKVLHTDDERQMINGHAALEMLARVLARGLEGDAYKGPKLSTGKRNIEKLERFFDIVIQVAPLPPVAYSNEDIARFARHSEAMMLKRVKDHQIGSPGVNSQEDLDDSNAFYQSIAGDYRAVAELAERGERAARAEVVQQPGYRRPRQFRLGRRRMGRGPLGSNNELTFHLILVD